MPHKRVEDRRAYFNKRYHNDPEFRSKFLAKEKARQCDKSKRAKWNAWRRKHRQKPDIKIKDRIERELYRLTHKEYFNSKGSEYRAKCRMSKTEPVDYKKVIEEANGICGICRKTLTLPIEIDHIIPISKGGTHTYDNLQATHASCNRHKSASLII